MKSSFLANICCSFEQEPQTLSEGQLAQAMEVAQNQAPTEASTTLFNQQGVVDDARKRAMQMGQNGGQVQKLELHESTQHKDHKTCRCFSTT